MADQQQQIRVALAELGELLDPLIEAAAGYKQKCAAAGFSPGAAEQMAVDFHRTMLTQIQGMS